MIRWVVTGPAGGGKSTFCRLLADHGAAILDGDRLGHEVLARPAIQDAVRREFGDHFVATGGVDRASLGRLVFRDPAALTRLNDITLGPIAGLASERLEELAADGRYRLAVLEAAVYFLFPPVTGVELVVTVTADPAIRLTRLVEKKGLTRAQAEARMAAQLPMEMGWAGADLVIDNGGALPELEDAAAALWARIDT